MALRFSPIKSLSKNVSLQVAAFTRYSSTLFTPDAEGDLIFTGLWDELTEASFLTEFNLMRAGPSMIPMFCGVGFC